MAYRASRYDSNETLNSQIMEEFRSIERAADSALEAKLKWCDKLQRFVERALPGSRLILVGSSTNLFGLRRSDCDMTVITKERVFGSEVQCLRKIEAALRPHRRRFEVESIYDAKVPILKLRDDVSSYEGDISINQENGVRSTYLLKCYASMDSRVRPLALMIKKWAKEAGITDARKHKLSGFAVILLVLHYLQKGCAIPVIPSLQATFPHDFKISNSIHSLAEKLCNTDVHDSVPHRVRTYSSRNNQSVAELFIGFFQFYSTFLWQKVISVRTGDYIPMGYGGTWRNPHIRIEDPYQLGNVTRSVYEYAAFRDIESAFKNALTKLQQNPSLMAIM